MAAFLSSSSGAVRVLQAVSTKKNQNRRREMHPDSSLHVGLSGQAH
jgi:hypothetical protein